MRLLNGIVCWVLFVTSAAKLASVFTGSPILQEKDVVFEWPLPIVLTVAAAAEIALGSLLLLTRDVRLRGLGIVTWSGIMVAYQVGAFMSSSKRPCSCFGDLLEWLNISDSAGIAIARFIVLAMLSVGVGMLLKSRQRYA